MGKYYLLAFVRIDNGFQRQLAFYCFIGTHGQKEKNNKMAKNNCEQMHPAQ